MASCLLIRVLVMVISPLFPAVPANPAAGEDQLLQASAAFSGAEFSALLFLILATPQAQNPVAQETDPPLMVNGDCTVGMPADLLEDSTASQARGFAGAESLLISPDTRGNGPAVTNVQKTINSNLVAPIEPQPTITKFEQVTSPSETLSLPEQTEILPLQDIAPSVTKISELNAQTRPITPTEKISDNVVDAETVVPKTENMPVDGHLDVRFVSEPPSAKNETIVSDAGVNGVNKEEKNDSSSSANEPPKIETPSLELPIIKNDPAVNLLSRPHGTQSAAEALEKPSLFQNAGNDRPNSTGAKLESALEDAKPSSAPNQNSSYSFADHREKIFERLPESGADHASEPSQVSIAGPSASINQAESAGTVQAAATSPSLPVIEQIATNIAASVHQNRHEAVITLDPPELGGLKINLAVDDNKIQVHILTEVHDSRSLIENHLPELKQALQVHRLDLVDVRVENANWKGNTGDLMHGFQRESHGGSQSSWNFGSESRPATKTPQPQGQAPAPARGRVSMWA